MTPFAFNVLLAVIWTALTGRLDLANFAIGFLTMDYTKVVDNTMSIINLFVG